MEIVDPMPQVHEFSDGYYLLDGLYVEPSDAVTEPVIQSAVYETLRRELLGDEMPLLFRHNNTQYHFRIAPSDNVRSDTIEMPFAVVDQMELQHVPAEEQFLLAKQSHATVINELGNGFKYD